MIKNDFAIILLTYKGKVLLVTNPEDNLHVIKNFLWHFISGKMPKNTRALKEIENLVKKEAKISLKSIDFLGSQVLENFTGHFFTAQLTDDNVNQMKTSDGQIINFFSPSELEKLSLKSTTKLFLKHRGYLENVKGTD